MKRILLTLLLLPGLLPPGLRAQERYDYEWYTAAAGIEAPVYRTRLAQTYEFPFNGTYRADTLGFLNGTLWYGGKRYDHMLLDIDARQQHLLVQYPGSPVVFDFGQERVERFDRGGIPYINLRAAGLNVPEGFFEEICTGRGTVYRLMGKVIQQIQPGAPMADIGYDDPHYRHEVLDYFSPKETWILLREDGSIFPLKRRNDFYKAFPTERKALRRKMSRLSETDADRASWTRAAMYYLIEMSHEK